MNEFEKHKMNANSVITDHDWMMPKELDTPDGSKPAPILYTIFSVQQNTNKDVTVSIFVDQLAKVMKDFEERISIVFNFY